MNEFDKFQLKTSLILSQRWFDNFQTDDNIVNYIYFPEKDLIEGRNLIREFGSFWGYSRLYNFNKNTESLRNINKIRKNSQAYIKYDDIEGVGIAYLEHEGIAEINTQAFYILALAELSAGGLKLTKRELSDLEKIVNGIYLMKAREGGLWYIYYLPEKHNKISPYGTSETLFALISYYKNIKQDRNVLSFIKDVFDEYYKISRKYTFNDEPARSFYSWILYFLVELSSIDSGYYFHIVDLIEKALDFRKNNKKCFKKGCLVTPLTISEAAFLEGGVYALALLEKNNFERLNELRQYIDLAVGDVLSMQILSFEDYHEKTGRISRGDKKYLIGGYCGGTNDGDYFGQTLRNDFTQHASSAILNYLNIL